MVGLIQLEKTMTPELAKNWLNPGALVVRLGGFLESTKEKGVVLDVKGYPAEQDMPEYATVWWSDDEITTECVSSIDPLAYTHQRDTLLSKLSKLFSSWPIGAIF
jgi:hypothetical protein